MEELYEQYEQDFINSLAQVTRTADNMSTASKGKQGNIKKI
jgi:hypothetical protein